jgi:hypothetical protein
MKLADTFEAVAYKELVASDLPNRRSHQHELTGVKSLTTIFGLGPKIQNRMKWVFFANGGEPATEDNDFTFYDARAKTTARTGRSEWRLYYHGNFLGYAEIGDLLIVAKTLRHGLVGMIFAKKSRAYKEAVSLFELGPSIAFKNLSSEYIESREWDAVDTRVLARWFGISFNRRRRKPGQRQ